MRHQPSLNCGSHALTLLLALVLTACSSVAASDKAACGKVGTIDMPSGVDAQRIEAVDQGKRPAVFTGVATTEDDPESLARMPAHMAAVTPMTNAQLRRVFSDVVKASRRFIVFDSRAALTADASTVMIDMQITQAEQRWVERVPGIRRARTRVDISVQMQDMLSGEDRLGAAVTHTGIWGDTSGEDTAELLAGDSPDSKDVRTQRGLDYQNALKRAMVAVSDRLEELLRPMGKVLHAEGCQVDVFGGAAWGLQPGDDVVVFRGARSMVGETVVFKGIRPVAMLNCTAVGPQQSQCRIVGSVPGLAPQADDYVVLTDESLQRTRRR